MKFSLNKVLEWYGSHILRYGWSDAYGNVIPPGLAESFINEEVERNTKVFGLMFKFFNTF